METVEAVGGERSTTGISSICSGASRLPGDPWRARQCFHSCGASSWIQAFEGTNDDDDDNEKSIREKRKYSAATNSRPAGSPAEFRSSGTFMNSGAVCNEDLSQWRNTLFRAESSSFSSSRDSSNRMNDALISSFTLTTCCQQEVYFFFAVLFPK